jgi:hypothetical protein
MSTTEIGIMKLSARSKTKLLGVAVASGVVAASLGAVPAANALCANISGLNLGTGCTASLGSIAIVLGPTGTAAAGDPAMFTPFNIAISVGTGTTTFAGTVPFMGLPNVGNVAFATAGSSAVTEGLLNLAASLGGTSSDLQSLGILNSTLNIGSHNVLASQGFVSNATVLFSDNNPAVDAGNIETGLNGLLHGFNVAFNIFGGGNTVLAGAFAGTGGTGPLSIAGALGVTAQTVLNTNFGIHIATPLGAVASVPAAGNKVAPTTVAAGTVTGAGSQLSGSLTKAPKQVGSALISPSKKAATTVSKAGAASTGGKK